ncbi:MAG: gamma-glutamyltransferase [Polyangiaceae bacterium]|nr:gamma-glutamyltransferase [Polyangiaceae bacterium]
MHTERDPSRATPRARIAGLAGSLAIAVALGLWACGPGGLGRGPDGPPAGGASASAGASAATTSAPAPGPEARGPRLAVATENATAAEVALAVLREGGSAADAAIAAVLVDGVVQPVSSGLGGGGFALYWDAAAKRATVLDFREVGPRDLRPSDFDARPPKEERRGVMVGVPGEVAGLFELHRRFGTRPFAELARPAAELARQGFRLDPHLARTLGPNEAWVKATPRYAAVFAPAGSLLAKGELTRNEALGRSLEKLAAEGRAAFYEGDLARDVVATANAAGGRLALEDLASYAVVEREPLHAVWEGKDVYTMPPPSAGGLLLLETLAMHGRADVARLGYGTGRYQHVLAETFRGAIADRMRFVGDPAFVKVDVAALTAPERMRARRAAISETATREADRFPLAESGTNHLVVVDAAGNVASLTSTVNDAFGARLVTAGGFPLNDELDDFARQAAEERFGKPGVNLPRPGARPVSSMTPTLVVADGRPLLALGGSGGTRIATGVAQVVLAVLAFDRTAAEAVADPRIEVPPMGGLVLEEATPDALAEDLRQRGETVAKKPNTSAIQLVVLGAGPRRVEAAGDPRKFGAGLVE